MSHYQSSDLSYSHYGHGEPAEHGSHDDSEGSSSHDVETRDSGEGSNDLADGAYFVEGERTYNNTSWVYRLPADHEEVIRQDRQHYIILAALPGLYRGPVEHILNDRSRHRRLLDIGCGTGIWTQEMAEMFPHVDCIGIDLMPMQHDPCSDQMRNCTFMRVFAPSGLKIFGKDSFDVVHIRQMLHATDEYQQILREAHRILRPGGILLLHEPQLHLHSAWEGFTAHELAPYLDRMLALLRRSQEHRGVNVELFSEMESVVVDAGFDNHSIDTYYHYSRAIVDDPNSEASQNQALNVISYLYASRLIILESGQIDEDGFDELLEGVSEEVRGRSTGSAGPLGCQGVLSPWGYWWAIKR